MRKQTDSSQVSTISRAARGHLYEYVESVLRRRIIQGLYPPGGRTPSESELMQEFKVSAITIRRAIRDLTIEGLLWSRQGLGVFVADKRRTVRHLQGDFQVSFADDMRKAGLEPGLQVLSLSLVSTDDPIRKNLAVGTKIALYRLDRLMLADGEPIGIDRTYLSKQLGDNLNQEISQKFILPLLVSSGMSIDHVVYEVEGGSVSEDDSLILHLPVGFPLLIVHYTTVATNGEVVMAGRGLTRADRFIYKFCVDPDRRWRRPNI